MSDLSDELRAYMARIGSKGGKRRSETTTPEQRRKWAKKAIRTRWAAARKRDAEKST